MITIVVLALGLVNDALLPSQWRGNGWVKIEKKRNM